MTEQVDPAGIERTETGQIVDQTPDPTSESQATGTPTTPSEPKTLLNEPAESKEEVKAEAPESYEDYKVPEGFTIDPEVKKEADALFKGMNLTQEQAQSLVDFYTKKATESHEAPIKAYKEMTDGWRSESENHPDLKGKLGRGGEVNARIGRALDSLGDSQLASQFRELMDLTGAGNHQAFIRVIDKFAQRIGEGSHASGNGPSRASQSAPDRAPPSAAEAMWPNLPSTARQ